MKYIASALLLSTALVACGGDSSGPVNYGTPSISQINGVTEPNGLVGMAVIIEGANLADAAHGTVYFQGSTGTPVAATVAAADWTTNFIITTVPAGTADSSFVWVVTPGGTTDSIPFTLITGSTFSPANISWTSTSALPQALQGLGAVSVRLTRGALKGANFVYVVGGADNANVATNAVYRARAQESGALGSWTATTLPVSRAYHATAAATAQTARIDTTGAGYIYVMGGKDQTGATVGTVHYARIGLDGTLGSWQATTALPAAVHGASATVFRGFVYITGGANSTNAPVATAYRAAVNANGTLGAWTAIASLPTATQFHTLVNFGPYLYVVGGDNGTVAPSQATVSGTEASAVYLGKVNVRDGSVPTWTATASQNKGRSKHSAIVAGGALLATSGVYSGQVGSSENAYASINADGTLASWGGATGSNTIQAVLGYGLYNAAAVTFIDSSGKGHVLVLGGGNRSTVGQASAAVLYY